MPTIKQNTAARLAARRAATTTPVQATRESNNALSASPRRNPNASGVTTPAVDPSRGTSGAGTMENPVKKAIVNTEFKDLQAAQDAATDERTRTGSVSQSTEAAIFRGQKGAQFLNNEQLFIDEIAKSALSQDTNQTEFRRAQAEDPFASRLLGADDQPADQRRAPGADLIDPRSGIRGPGTGTGAGLPQIGGRGVLEKSALERLMKPREEGGGGLTQEEALQKIQDLKPSIQATLSNTGLGTPASRGSEREVKLQDDLAAIDAGLQALVDSGTAGPQASVIAQAKKANILAEYNAGIQADAATATAKMTARQENQAPTTTIETPTSQGAQITAESLLAGLSPEQADMARNMLGQGFFDNANEQLGGIDINTPEGSDAVGSITQQMGNFMSNIFSQTAALANKMDDFSKQQLVRKDAEAEAARIRQERDIELARRKQQTELNRTIREGEITQEQNRQDWMTGLGLESGWFASTRSAAVIRALSAGERIISDRKSDLAFTNEFYTNKLMDAEEVYHETTVQNAENYRASSLQLQQNMLAESKTVSQTIFNTAKEEIAARAKMKEDWLKQQTELIEKRETRQWDAMKFFTTEDRMNQAQASAEYQKEVSNTFDYLAKFGTQNKAELARREAILGYPAGSLTNQKTLAEIKKYGSPSTVVDGVAMADLIDSTYNSAFDIMISAGKTSIEAAILAQDASLQTWNEHVGSSSKLGPSRVAGQTYVNIKYGAKNGHLSVIKTRTLIESEVVGDGSYLLEEPEEI